MSESREPTPAADRAALMFAGETVEYGPLAPGHTNGDLYVFFRGANLLMASDVVSVGRYPIMDYRRMDRRDDRRDERTSEDRRWPDAHRSGRGSDSISWFQRFQGFQRFQRFSD